LRRCTSMPMAPVDDVFHAAVGVMVDAAPAHLAGGGSMSTTMYPAEGGVGGVTTVAESLGVEVTVGVETVVGPEVGTGFVLSAWMPSLVPSLGHAALAAPVAAARASSFFMCAIVF